MNKKEPFRGRKVSNLLTLRPFCTFMKEEGGTVTEKLLILQKGLAKHKVVLYTVFVEKSGR